MAQYYENGPVHSAPRPAPTVAGGHRASRSVARMDCDDCPIAGTGCGVGEQLDDLFDAWLYTAGRPERP